MSQATSLRSFVDGVMKQKQIDHEASHSNLINQYLHLISSSIFLYCYAIFFNDYRNAIYLGLGSLVLRQAGHYVFEPPCHEKEQAMLGFDTKKKVKIVITYFIIPTVFLIGLSYNSKFSDVVSQYDVTVADLWLIATLCVVFGRVIFLWYTMNFVTSMHWFVKFVTDPWTDIPAYWRSSYQILNPKLLKYALHKSFPNMISAPSGMENIEMDSHGHHGVSSAALKGVEAA